jgi:hypothetical protein
MFSIYSHFIVKWFFFYCIPIIIIFFFYIILKKKLTLPILYGRLLYIYILLYTLCMHKHQLSNIEKGWCFPICCVNNSGYGKIFWGNRFYLWDKNNCILIWAYVYNFMITQINCPIHQNCTEFRKP